MVDHDVLLSLGHGTEKWYLDTIDGTTCDALKVPCTTNETRQTQPDSWTSFKLGLLV